MGALAWVASTMQSLGRASISALLFSLLVGLLGPVLYWVTAAPHRERRLSVEPVGD